MPDRVPLVFEIIVHVMEAFVVLGIAASVYFVKKSKAKRRASRNPGQR